jgi:hypothetical protein
VPPSGRLVQYDPAGPVGGGVKIGLIVHRAVIEVAEESTEAAAATAIVIAPTAACPCGRSNRKSSGSIVRSCST